tara:strand:- start:407 stop:766 length:360 start_codon:yes stop_codon:yes gene_type:complete
MTPHEQEQEEIIIALHALLVRQRKLSYTQPEKATVVETLGILVSKYTGWDGEAIYLVAHEALTDANFHALAAKLKYLWDRPFVRAEQLCAAEDAGFDIRDGLKRINTDTWIANNAREAS